MCRSSMLLLVMLLVGCETKQAGPPQPAPQPTGEPAIQGPSPDSATVPAAPPVSGTILGKAFQPDSVRLEGGNLEFRMGKDFFADAMISVQIQAKYGEPLEGKKWKFDGEFESPTVVVSSRANKNDLPKTEFVFGSDHQLELMITKASRRSIEGVITFKAKKLANTSLQGSFTAEIKKGAADPLDEDDAPYIAGKVQLTADTPEVSTSAGFIGVDANGKQVSNEAGYAIGAKSSGGHVTSTTFAPQLTSLIVDKIGANYHHTHLPPGKYLVYLRREKLMVAWKVVEVKAGDRHEVNFEIDPKRGVDLEVTLPDEEASDKSTWDVSLIPATPDLPPITSHFAFQAAPTKVGEKKVTIKGVAPGKYRVVRGRSEAEVEVVAGKPAAVTLVRAK